MKASDILFRLRAKGFNFKLEPRLVAPKGATMNPFTDEQKRFLSEHREAIIDELCRERLDADKPMGGKPAPREPKTEKEDDLLF